MTRIWHRRLIRLHNNWPPILTLILGAAVIVAAGGYTVDRVASLGARMARAML